MTVKSMAGLCTVLCLMSLQAMANTVYLVRHAEKQATGSDPKLTACGEARAQALAQYFAEVELGAVYATPYQRTQQTAVAVAQSKQLKVQLYDPREPAMLVQQLTRLSPPVLVVGHSNTVPQLVTLLTGFDMAALSEQDYSMLYRLDINDETSVTITRQRFSCI